MDEEEYEEEPSEDLKQYIKETEEDILKMCEKFATDILTQHALLQEVGAYVKLDDVFYMIRQTVNKHMRIVKLCPNYMNILLDGLEFNKGQIN